MWRVVDWSCSSTFQSTKGQEKTENKQVSPQCFFLPSIGKGQYQFKKKKKERKKLQLIWLAIQVTAIKRHLIFTIIIFSKKIRLICLFKIRCHKKIIAEIQVSILSLNQYIRTVINEKFKLCLKSHSTNSESCQKAIFLKCYNETQHQPYDFRITFCIMLGIVKISNSFILLLTSYCFI